MADRWERLRRAVKCTRVFSVAEYPPAVYCSFMREMTNHLPAFAWLKSERDDIEDAASYLYANLKILARSGNHFGTSNKHVRIG
ncbi:hypothetical protein HPP92_004914 [Vanilla planifolia]|uniref:Alliinase C-terminal domain-containing protein n=1 Tax=Vanilla planifolia TaxID=51239 RepID=A0A835VCQ4_VANPL|nr:hypothetical protein HPP92_004914 [Vanilla planifolia]